MKVAIVTGATRGIGRVIALALGRAGYAVVVTGRTISAGTGKHDAMGGSALPGSVEETVAQIEAAGGTALGAMLDLLDRDSIEAAIKATLARFGRIDVLVNNGVFQGPVVQQKIADVAIEDAERAVIGNFVNQFYLSRLVMQTMIPQGSGRIIFVTSLSSVSPAVGDIGLFYAAPKAAFNRIHDSINFEHGKDGISAFLIEPQFTLTDTLRTVLGAEADKVGYGRQARDPEETARTVVWLASDPRAPQYVSHKMINAPDFFQNNGIEPRVE